LLGVALLNFFFIISARDPSEKFLLDFFGSRSHLICGKGDRAYYKYYAHHT
jgi:hypothetical protein